MPGLPSYLTMLKGKSSGKQLQNMLPRWWLATDYKPLLTDGQGLAWQLRGQGVKAMAEDDFLAADGTRKRSGKSHPAAQRWADNMTARYEELSSRSPIFGQLRNCMDLAVMAALLLKEDLPGTSGCGLGLLLDEIDLQAERFPAPSRVSSQASLLETRKNYLISVSGGVSIDSWEVAAKRETSDELAPIRSQAAPGAAEHWWWN